MSGRHYRSNRGKERSLPARDAYRMIKRDERLLRKICELEKEIEKRKET